MKLVVVHTYDGELTAVVREAGPTGAQGIPFWIRT